MGRAIDITGQKFGRLTVLFLCKERNNRSRIWCCLCECGKNVRVPTGALQRGSYTSCGCQRRERARTLNRKHGMKGTLTYRSWEALCYRCRGKKGAKYHRYGGRGITVCDRWQGADGFKNFYEDMGPRPSPDHSIDRIDNDKGYFKENCRWATRKEQANNRHRSQRTLTYNGETKTLKEWGRMVGKHGNILNRRRIHGWSVEDILFKPVRKTGGS